MNFDNIKKLAVVVIAITTVVFSAPSAPATGDRAEVRVWYNKDNGSQNGISSPVELISIDNVGGEQIFNFKFTGLDGTKAQFPMPSNGFVVGLRLSNYRPVAVTAGSSRLLNGPWITGIVSNFGFSGTRELFFPVLPPSENYDQTDWYQIRLNDSIQIYCQYTTEKRMFYGTVKKVTAATGVHGEKIDGGELYSLHTRDNPFRLSMVVIHSSITRFVNPGFKGLGDGYYGITIGNYSSVMKRDQRQQQRPGTNDNRARSFDGQGRSR
jgi:hypothetical protein